MGIFIEESAFLEQHLDAMQNTLGIDRWSKTLKCMQAIKLSPPLIGTEAQV